jgi:hypothetical protein
MSGPRTKRQFAGAASDPSQRSITSFFTKTSSPADAAQRSSNQAALDGPALPPQVQTDLLTVGMRVRKAIPEGYKTGGTYSAFTLWAEDTNAASCAGARPTSTAPSAAFTSSMRELEPFCGLNKVGGLAFQPAHNNHNSSASMIADDDLDSMSGLTSSQDTIASDASSIAPSLGMTMAIPAAPGRKRIFTSDEDSAAHDAHSTSLPYRGRFRRSCDIQEAWLEDEISPRSLAPPPGLWENARVLAVPVPRRAKQGGSRGGAAGQENVMVVERGGGQDGNDFEEASFLDYGVVAGEGGMDME